MPVIFRKECVWLLDTCRLSLAEARAVKAQGQGRRFGTLFMLLRQAEN